MINVTHAIIDGVLFLDVQTDLGSERYAMEISNGQIEFNQTKPMSKDKYKHAMERLADMAEGKEIEWNDCGLWKKDSEPWLQSVDHMNSPNLIRTKETPAKIPFGPEDIRPGMVFNTIPVAPNVGFTVPARVGLDGILFVRNNRGADVIQWEHLQKFWAWSTDGTTWHPCEKPSPTPPKREPRRVWVNMDRSGEPGNVWNSIEEAKRRKDESWCSESAVEFVEVIK